MATLDTWPADHPGLRGYERRTALHLGALAGELPPSEASLGAIETQRSRPVAKEGSKAVEPLVPEARVELLQLAGGFREATSLSAREPETPAPSRDGTSDRPSSDEAQAVETREDEGEQLRPPGTPPPAESTPEAEQESAPRELDPKDQQMLDQLVALGYLQGSAPAPADRNVTIHRRELAYPGLNFMVSGHGPEALLFDMDGKVLHRWSHSYEDAFPGRDPTRKRSQHFWRRAYLYENGDVLAIFDGLGLIKVDKDSKLLWATQENIHHDLFLGPRFIYTLSRVARVIPRIHPSNRVLEDFIVFLLPNGKELLRVSIYEMVLNSEYASWLDYALDRGDIFHTNTIEIFDGKKAHLSPHYREGNVLISIHGLDAIGIVDLKAGKLVWGMRGPFKRQHQPTLLENGNILVFDNLGHPERFSRVLEIEMGTNEIVWSYQAKKPGAFFTLCCGTSERLPNGNTLITETDGGKAFEVTPEKEIVWQFQSPYRTGDDDELVASLFEVVRLPADFPIDWAQGESPAAD